MRCRSPSTKCAARPTRPGPCTPGLTQGAYECLLANGTPQLQATYLPKLVVGRMDRHHVPDRSRIAAPTWACCARAPSRSPTAATASPARRSSSPPASTIWPTTSCTWCWPGCRTRPPAPGASRCSWCRSSCPRARAQRRAWVRATPLYCGGIEHKMGIHGNSTCQIVFEGATGWLVGEPTSRPECDVRDDERGAPGAWACRAWALTDVAYQNAAAYATRAGAGQEPGARRRVRTSRPIRSSCIPTCAARC